MGSANGLVNLVDPIVALFVLIIGVARGIVVVMCAAMLAATGLAAGPVMAEFNF